MKSISYLNVFLFLGLLILTACGETAEKEDDKTIILAVSANMQFAMEALTEAFLEETGVQCQSVVSSSGKLTAQIKKGAPFDVFVAANMKYPNEIQNSGLAASPPKVYAYGQLVLWSVKEDMDLSVDMLTQEVVRHIAVANPTIAPYGVAAVEALRNHGLLEQLEEKLVYGESIAQTNQFILTGSAEAGFTAQSVVLSPRLKGKGHWIAIEESYYPPIEQGVVVIQRDKPREAARKFYDYLSSEKARSILEKYGYGIGKN